MEDLGLIPGLARSPGGRHGNPLQYSCQENPHGQRSLMGYNPWGRKQSDKTKWLSRAQPSKHRFSPESTLVFSSWCTHSLQTVLSLTLLQSLLLLSYFPALQLYSHIIFNSCLGLGQRKPTNISHSGSSCQRMTVLLLYESCGLYIFKVFSIFTIMIKKSTHTQTRHTPGILSKRS